MADDMTRVISITCVGQELNHKYDTTSRPVTNMR